MTTWIIERKLGQGKPKNLMLKKNIECIDRTELETYSIK